MRQTIVLDTGTFLGMLAGLDEEGRVYQKIVRRCDRVAIDENLLEEYRMTRRHKFPIVPTYLILTRLAELKALGKLLKIGKAPDPPEDVDRRDRHVVAAAKAAKADYLVTGDRKDLWDRRGQIKERHNLQVLRPQDYLALDS